MGQKIHPTGFRLGSQYTWRSRWFADDDATYKSFLLADVTLRRALQLRLKTAGLARMDIERSINKLKITLFVSRPGIVIGRGGSGLEDLKRYIEDLISQKPSGKADQIQEKSKLKVEISVEPVKEPNLNAYLVATNIADQIARRIPHKRVCLQAVDRVMSAGAKGVKVLLAGRIGGAEIHRKEKFQDGTVPLSTIREDIDYAQVPSLTKSGFVGVKVWICRKS
ncbi:30S ribosomal protein S3 [Candidatus Gottesmanbacteria bacterium RBG_16_43_7]|uniref:Small ribosomal subunit protein uS3 n=1 Tax=Candidatus Gottesmanbacteria bacterium RBG_16_43_7 TaxID=1798373 RepID=A0A1F5ZA15_9BACT|nr:MAG: 30S ribosomal protein S3 [Candidatus Gottesmanbacteria bacterium RBG_16_43_7]